MTHNWNQQVPVATPEMIENLSESTLQGVRREGCFILRHVTEDIVECKAVQDGYVFQCPKKHLTSMKTVRAKISQLYSEASRRCACGIKTCDEDSLFIRKSLIKMGFAVPMHKRIVDFSRTQKYIKNVRVGSDSRVAIRHFITWSDSAPTPTIFNHPKSSSREMTNVKRRCTMLTDNNPKKKTRQNQACPDCLNLQTRLTSLQKEQTMTDTRHKEALRDIKSKFEKEILSLKQKIQNLQFELQEQKKQTRYARGERHGDVKTSIYASVLSGIQFWQHKRQHQIKGTLGLCDHKTWDVAVGELYKAVQEVVEWSTNFVVMCVRSSQRSCAADVRWSHVGAHAKHCTAVIVDVDEDAVVSRSHVSKDTNKLDRQMEVWKGSSGAMEVKGLELNFGKLKKKSILSNDVHSTVTQKQEKHYIPSTHIARQHETQATLAKTYTRCSNGYSSFSNTIVTAIMSIVQRQAKRKKIQAENTYVNTTIQRRKR